MLFVCFRGCVVYTNVINYSIMVRSLSLLLLFTLLSTLLYGEDSSQGKYFEWSNHSDIPEVESGTAQPGLAGHFSQIFDNRLIVGGGGNFPDAPVAEGGAKVWHDDIYILDSPESVEWSSKLKLPYNWGYGVAVSTKRGVVIIGGENESGALKSVIRVRPLDDKLEVDNLPDLPVKMVGMMGGIINSTVVVSGGVQDGSISNRSYALDLSKEGSDLFKWIEVAPMPGEGRKSSAYTVQNSGDRDLLYVFGGFNSSVERGVPPTIYTDGLSFDLKTNEWTALGDILTSGGSPRGLNAATAVAYGPSHIIFFGGANYDVFNRAIKRGYDISIALSVGDSAKVNRLKSESLDYLKQPIESYKFSKDVLSFNTITKQWVDMDHYPYLAPAVASGVYWEKSIWIVNGEKKPGVRNRAVVCAKRANSPEFGFVNYAVLILYLLAMLGLGFYFMRKAKNTDQFFKGGGEIPWWAAGISLFATALSAITFMAIPAKTYATNWLYFPMALSTLIVAPFVIRYFLPFFRKLNLTSAYEYLEHRFNLAARVIASGIFLVFMVARIAIVLYLPSLALSTVSGIDIYFCIIIMSIITIIYCTMGGVEAVIWGDVIQGIILVFGAILSIVVLVIKTGGINETISLAVDANKFEMLDFTFSLTEPTFWVIFFGAGIANSLIPYTSDQSLIQRYMTTETDKKAAKSIWLNGYLSIPISLLFYFIGSALYSFYTKSPIHLEPDMPNTGGIFPHFIMSELPVGVAGLLIAAIFAATMSTISSNINSVSTAFTTDFYARFNPNCSDRSQMNVARISGIICGLIGTGIALMMVSMNIKSFFDQFNAIIGLLSSGLAGLFIMGIFFKSISGKGAIIGLVVSVGLLIFIKNFTDIHFMLYGLIGILSSVIIGYISSMILPKDSKDVSELTVRK